MKSDLHIPYNLYVVFSECCYNVYSKTLYNPYSAENISLNMSENIFEDLRKVLWIYLTFRDF